MKRTRRPEHQNEYKKRQNKVANMIKNAKSRYLNPSNPKSYSKLVTKQTSSIPILKDFQEKAIYDDNEKATLLNEFFHRVSVIPNHHLTYQITMSSVNLTKTCALSSSSAPKMMSWRCCYHWTQPSQIAHTAYLLQC